MKLTVPGYLAVAVSAILTIAYAIQSCIYYAKYYDIQLNFVPPSIRYAPMDILGFGFFVYWIPLFVIQISLIYIIYAGRTKNRKISIAIMIGFIAVSALDFIAFEELEGSVLHGR